MIQIRTSVFETNSSMTHSIVMCPTNDYEDWKANKSMFCEYLNPMFLPVEEARKYNADILKKWYEANVANDDENADDYMYFENEVLEVLTLENIYKYEQGDYDLDDFYFNWWDIYETIYTSYEYWYEHACEEFEDFVEDYEQNGEKVTAFGYYGHD